MKLRCSTCGEPLGDAVQTSRGRAQIARRRPCPNGHIVKTIETYAGIQEITRRLRDMAQEVDRRATRWQRDQRIVRMVRSGKVTKAEAASFYGIAPNTVSVILGKFAPELKRAPRGAQRKGPSPLPTAAPQPVPAPPPPPPAVPQFRTTWRFPGALPWSNHA